MLAASYPCGHSAESYTEPPTECPLCSKYGDIVPTKAKIKERLDRAYRVKPVVPSGRAVPNYGFAVSSACPAKTKRTWELVIDGWRPMLLNKGRIHWSIMKQGKDTAVTMFSLAAAAAGCPRATGQRIIHLRLEGYRQKQHLPDQDAADKVVLDALKRAGLITDDDADGVLGRMGFEAVLGKERRTVLLIGEVA